MGQHFNSPQLQQDLFQFIREKHNIPKDKILTNQLIQLFGVTKSTVYRWHRGEVLLKFSDVVKLVQHFGVSLDQFVYPKGRTLLFDFPNLNNPITSLDDYLKPIAENLNHLAAIPNSRVDYISREIPIFHYFRYPELMAFKAFIWGKTMWEFSDFDGIRKFNLSQIKGVERYRTDILDSYNQISGIEVWGTNSLEITFNQIEYYLQMGMFDDPREALVLSRQLRSLMDHLYQLATRRKKIITGENWETSADFTLYYSELSPSNNFLIAQSDTYNRAFVTIDNLHTIQSEDPQLLQFMDRWKRTLRKQSELITADSDKKQNKFFNDAEIKLVAFDRKVSNYVGRMR